MAENKEIVCTEFDSFYVVAGTKYNGFKTFFNEDGLEFGMPSDGDCGFCTPQEAEKTAKEVKAMKSESYFTDIHVEKATMYWSSEPIN